MKLAIAALIVVPGLAIAQVPAPPQQLPQPDELLHIAFPKWLDEVGGRVQSIPATAVTQAWRSNQARQRIPKGQARRVEVVPRHVLRVGQDRVLLVASMNPVLDEGATEVSHGTPTGLAAYIFAPGKNGWRLVKRQEPFALQGFDKPVQMDIVPLSTNAQALFVGYGSCRKGYCNDYFALYALGADGVKPAPLVQQPIGMDNVYTRPDCVDRLSSVVAGLDPADQDGHPPAPGVCEMISGRWELASKGAVPGPLTLHFHGGISRTGSTGADRIAQSMKFEYRGGRYVAVSGRNPVRSY